MTIFRIFGLYYMSKSWRFLEKKRLDKEKRKLRLKEKKKKLKRLKKREVQKKIMEKRSEMLALQQRALRRVAAGDSGSKSMGNLSHLSAEL